MRHSGRWRARWRVGIACCATLLIVLLTAPAAAGTAAAHASVPAASRSCGLAIGAPRSAPAAAQSRMMAPRLTLSPSHGAAGTKIVAIGSGWPQGATISIIARTNGQGIFSQPAVSSTVQSDGTFTLTFPAPATTCTFTPTLGQVVQFVAATASGAQSASASFTFDVPAPTLTAPPNGGQLASSAVKLPVRGTNWGAGAAVTVWATTLSTPANAQDAWLPPAGVPVVVVIADARGQIAGNVPLPASLLPLRPGAFLGLAASATGPGYGQLITYLPSAYQVALGAQPTLVASQQTVAQGGALRVSGDHWWPGDTLHLLYCQGAPHPTKLPKLPIVRCNPAQSATLGTAQVDSTGHFAATLTIPSQAPTGAGTLEASVSGDFDDPFTATRSLQVTASANPGVWLTGALGPTAPVIALLLLALAGLLAALWRILQQRPASRAAQRG